MALKTAQRLRPQLNETRPIVVIQVVHSRWNKSSRGGAGAVERNKMPEAFRLPATPDASSKKDHVLRTIGQYYGLVAYSDGMRPAPLAEDITSGENFGEFKRGCVHVRLEKGILSADYVWTPAHGMPERYQKRDVLTLQLGQWGRVRYNERHDTREGSWWYEKWVFNIGVFSRVTPSVFLRTESALIYSEMDHLW